MDMAYEEAKWGSGQSSASIGVKKTHSLCLTERKRLTVSGVEEVESFDEAEIVMRTVGGGLVIGGAELSVSRLDLEAGEVDVEGTVDSLRYEEGTARSGLWGRLFH